MSGTGEQKVGRSKEKIERTPRSRAFYQAVFGDFINPTHVQNILDVGAGDSKFISTPGQRVVRVDKDYERSPPVGEDWYTADARQLADFYGQFPVAISSFMMQHLSHEDQAVALNEILQTVVDHVQEERSEGYVGIYPVYKPSRLERVLRDSGFDQSTIVAHSQDNLANLDRAPTFLGYSERKRAKYSILWIEKRPGLDTQALAATVAESGALSRRTTFSDLARRASMPEGVSYRNYS